MIYLGHEFENGKCVHCGASEKGVREFKAACLTPNKPRLAPFAPPALKANLLCVTTNAISGKPVASYIGLVATEVIFGANFLKDFAASITDFVGGRSTTYEKVFEDARSAALQSLIGKAAARGADAILGMRFNYQVLGENNGMMMVAAFGTAVQLAKSSEAETNRKQVDSDGKVAGISSVAPPDQSE